MLKIGDVFSRSGVKFTVVEVDADPIVTDEIYYRGVSYNVAGEAYTEWFRCDELLEGK